MPFHLFQALESNPVCDLVLFAINELLNVLALALTGIGDHLLEVELGKTIEEYRTSLRGARHTYWKTRVRRIFAHSAWLYDLRTV